MKEETQEKLKAMSASAAKVTTEWLKNEAAGATGWVRVAWIIGAAVVGAIGWLLGGADTTQQQPEVAVPPTVEQSADK